ncbi:MAG: hypothetical protein IJM04_04060 [Prevotella sp.]|nr:hypothetical protein [Prevotella sp.]
MAVKIPGTTIPILGGIQRLKPIPFLELVGNLVQIIRAKITDKSKNSFLYIACDGKSTTHGRAGQEEDLIVGVISVLESDETMRNYVLNYYKQKKLKEKEDETK